MSKKFLTPINLLSRDTDPEEGFNGDIYFNTILNQIKLYSSSAWNVISTSSSTGGGASVLVSDTPPESPTANSLWYESDTGDMFIYYDSYWVQVNNGGVDENYLNSTASAIGQRLLASTASTLYLGINNTANHANTASSINWSLVTSKPNLLTSLSGGSGITVGGTSTDPTVSLNTIINPISSSPTYNLVLSDAGELIELNHSSSVRVVIPLDSTVAFPIGTTIDILQTGTGEVTASYVSGVILNSNGGAVKLSGQWSAASLIKRQTNTWVLIGDITV